VKALEGMGINVRNKDDRGNYITAKSNLPIKAYNSSSDEIPGDIVGNGSKARAVVGSYDWTFSGKTGRSPSLLKLVVDELEVYEGTAEGGVVEVGEAL
jgi:ATP phosphoribosyltransferase